MMDTGHVIHTFTLSSQPRNFGRHAARGGPWRAQITTVLSGTYKRGRRALLGATGALTSQVKSGHRLQCNAYIAACEALSIIIYVCI